MQNKRGSGVIIGLIIIAVLLVGGFFLFSGDKKVEDKSGGGIFVTDNSDENSQQEAPTTDDTNSTEYTVSYGSSGFSPNSIEINQGDKVIFVNEGSSNIRVASNNHPTHTLYPGSGAEKCGTDEEENIFDSCDVIAPGEIYSFVFNEVGTWGYHNHLSPSKTGTVIVN